MQFNCTIEMENDAFKGTEPLTHPILEVARILQELSKDLVDAYIDMVIRILTVIFRRDRNGNKVGTSICSRRGSMTV